MKIIIFGVNEAGMMIASQFYKDNDITVIGDEKNKTEGFSKLDISIIDGNGSSIETLNQAGLKDADIFIACTESDELNIVSCMTAKHFSKICTMCFIRKEEYKSSLGYTKDAEFNGDFYTDYVIWPEELLTQEIFRIITVAKALDVENFANGKARLLEYKISENSVLLNKKIMHCDFPKETLIVGIKRGEELFIPSGETVLHKDDKVIFMGLSHSLDVLAGKFFHEKEFVKNVVIIGGGNVGLKLAKNLEDLNLNVKIIEKDENRCRMLSQVLSSALVINGDGTDIELLNEEDVNTADVVVSVTNNDEKNLLCSLMVKQLGAKRVISRVSNNANLSLFERVGIDITLSTMIAAVNEVKSNIFGSNLDILATVEQGKGEVIEINLLDDFKDTKIMDLRLPSRAVVAVVRRRNRVIIPNGNTLLMKGDNLIVFTKSEDVQNIRKYFKVG